MEQVFRRIVSLGASCEAQSQVRRLTGDVSERRRRVSGIKNTALGCPSSVFSWQITPIQALITYLRQDFEGMMQFEHLALSKRTVVNTVYGTEHHHEFRMDSTMEAVAEQFAAARKKHDAMCLRTRRMISDDEPTLFVVSNADATPDQRAEVESLLKRFNPGKRIGLLFVETPDIQADWRGDDASWDKAFASVHFSTKLSLREKVDARYIQVKGQILRFADHVKTGRF